MSKQFAVLKVCVTLLKFVEVVPSPKSQSTLPFKGLVVFVNVTVKGTHPERIFALKLTTGEGLTTTLIEELAVQPFAEVVTVYNPEFNKVVFVIEGFWIFELKFGPIQLYVVPETVEVEEIKFKLFPSQIGPFELAVIVGEGLTVTIADPAKVAEQLLVPELATLTNA